MTAPQTRTLELSSEDMDRIGRVGLTPLDWARERLANSERIAVTKHGDDREAWHEDEAYWRAIVIGLAALRVPSSAQEEPEKIKAFVMAVEEMDGPAPADVVDYALAYPVEAMRCAVRATKKEIADRIDARLASLQEPTDGK